MGALGPVFRTYEPTRDRLVAVKVFRLDVTPEQAQALADELAHAAEAELIHPSIVEPIAAGVEGTVAYRAEEYVAAESLDAAMRHYAPASFDTMLRIVGQLAEAIDSARAAGVGHGALHPRDIFITPDEARASGFGVVDALERVGLRAPVRRPYSAPERIAGAGWSTAADVFSLGAIAFELLTGRRPSGTGPDIGPLTGATVSDPGRLQAVLAQAMAEDPDDRFATGLELADALAAAGAAIHAATPTFAEEEDAIEEEDATEVESEPPTDTGSAIRMIALPVEPPVFAEERSARAAATTPSLFVDVPYDRPSPTAPAVTEPVQSTQAEPDDITAEREEDEAHWSLTHDEDSALATGPLDVRDLEAAEYAPDDVEAAADALAFEAADLSLREEPAPADDFHRFSRARREAAVASPVEGDEEFGADTVYEPPLAIPAARLDRPEAAPQQVIEREIPVPSAHEADERVPFEHFTGDSERPRTAVLPLALMLLVGLLIGFGGGYVVRGRQPAAPVAPSADASAPATEPAPSPVEPVDSSAGRGTSSGRVSTDRSTTSAPAAAPRPATPAGAARSGTLIVRSTPSGAGVTINGKWSGRTPLTQHQLPFGDYTVRATLPGYQAKPEEVTLSADAASRTLSLQLQKEVPRGVPPAAPRPAPAAPAAPAPRGTTPAETPGAATGAMEIDSRPTGAKVFVDDRAAGATPVRLPDVTPGSHTVRLELPEHHAWTETVQVTRGKTTRVAGSLEPIR